MDKTFLGLVDTQVDALKNSASQAERTTVILELVKLLLDNAAVSSDLLSTYDKFGIRELFAAYNAVGKKVCAFYDASKGALDPAAQNGSIGKKMTEAEAQISETTHEFDALTKNEAALLAREDELSALNASYEAAQAKVAELKRISAEVSDEVIEALTKESARLSAEIKKNTEKKKATDTEVSDLRKLHQEVSSAYLSVSEEERSIKAGILSVITDNRTQLERIFRAQNQDLTEVEAAIQRYIEEFEKIDAQVLESGKTLAFYKSWLGENSTILQSMRKYGVDSLNKLTAAIDSVKANAEYELKAYDAIIRKVVAQEETIRNEILRKQNKVI